MCVLIWLENTNKGGDTMFDYWVSEVIAERVYQVNEVYFDAGNIIPCTDIYFSEFPAFTVAKKDNIYLIKKILSW